MRGTRRDLRQIARAIDPVLYIVFLILLRRYPMHKYIRYRVVCNQLPSCFRLIIAGIQLIFRANFGEVRHVADQNDSVM